MNVIDFGAVVATTAALCEVAKRTGLPARWVPLLAAVLGVVAGVLYLSPDEPLQGVFLGLTAGLTAVGAYSGVSHVAGARE